MARKRQNEWCFSCPLLVKQPRNDYFWVLFFTYKHGISVTSRNLQDDEWHWWWLPIRQIHTPSMTCSLCTCTKYIEWQASLIKWSIATRDKQKEKKSHLEWTNSLMKLLSMSVDIPWHISSSFIQAYRMLLGNLNDKLHRLSDKSKM